MSGLIDPDGANRIIKQQISEWHAERREDRNSRLLEPKRRGSRQSFVGQALGLLIQLTRAPRSRRDDKPGATAREPQASPVEAWVGDMSIHDRKRDLAESFLNASEEALTFKSGG